MQEKQDEQDTGPSPWDAVARVLVKRARKLAQEKAEKGDSVASRLE